MTSGGFEIRAAGAADLPALLRLYRHLQPEDTVLAHDLARQRFDSMLIHPGMTVFVSLSGGTAVATITLIIVPNLTRGAAPYALIENVVTESTHRKRGHAGALIRQGFRKAWNDGCYKVMLLSGSHNPETLDFYRNCGFTQDKTGFQIRRPAGV